MENIKKLFASKRALMTIAIFIAWISFGVLGIIYNTNMTDFAVYFAALSPFIVGYIYGETKRPSNKKCCEAYED